MQKENDKDFYYTVRHAGDFDIVKVSVYDPYYQTTQSFSFKTNNPKYVTFEITYNYHTIDKGPAAQPPIKETFSNYKTEQYLGFSQEVDVDVEKLVQKLFQNFK